MRGCQLNDVHESIKICFYHFSEKHLQFFIKSIKSTNHFDRHLNIPECHFRVSQAIYSLADRISNHRLLFTSTKKVPIARGVVNLRICLSSIMHVTLGLTNCSAFFLSLIKINQLIHRE